MGLGIKHTTGYSKERKKVLKRILPFSNNITIIPHDVRTIKRAYPKLRLLTGTYILQENRTRFGGCSIRECCLLCGEGAETRVHFIAGCYRLEAVRMNFKAQLITILSRKNPLNVVNEVCPTQIGLLS